MTDSKSDDALFHRPNPHELKQAAKQDPLQNRSDQPEANVAETGLEAQLELDREGAVELADS